MPSSIHAGYAPCQSRRWASLLLLPVGMLVLAGVASAQDGEALVREKRCYACHAMSEPLIGPPYRAIAALHSSADREVIVEVLAHKIIAGGAGNWGVVPMVPSEHVSPEEARAIAAWILRIDSMGPGRRG